MNEKIEETIGRIEYYNRKFPKEDLQFLLDNQAEATPFLLNSIQNADEVLEKFLSRDDYMLPLYAFYMLAQFRDKQAYPLIYEIFAADKTAVDNAFGDFITEDLGRVLASVAGGDVSLINRLIEDEDVYEYVRSAAMDSWLCLVRAGIKTREETVAYYKTLFEMPCEKESFIRRSLISNCLELNAPELLPEIKQSFDDNLVDMFMSEDWEEVEREMSKGKSRVLDGANKHYDLVTDMISDLGVWIGVREPQEFLPLSSNFRHNQPTQNSPNYQVVWESNTDGTFVRETPKVGKNEPCPCGSGRKYKKCCMN